MEVLETAEVEAVQCDMQTLFERAFNPRLCKEIAERADRNLTTLLPIYVNGVQHNIRGTSICFAQVIQLAKKDWCATSYKVMYRDDLHREEQMKELRVGVTIRATPNMAFVIQRDYSEDNFVATESERRLLRRL